MERGAWSIITLVQVRETRSASSQKRSERRRKYWQRVEPDIHSLNRWPVKCIEMSRKRRVQTDKQTRGNKPRSDQPQGGSGGSGGREALNATGRGRRGGSLRNGPEIT